MSQTITHDKVETSDKSGVDYPKVVSEFGCQLITDDLLEKIRLKTKQPKLHHLLERKVFFAHRDLDKLIASNDDFYIYTGRGPSSDSLHIGHMIPFMMAKYLQDLFDVTVIIQITDDEKVYNSKKEGETLETYQQYAINNIEDIITCGFNPDKTFIFLNSQYSSKMIHNLAKIMKKVNLNQIKVSFGFQDDTNIGKVSFPPQQMTPSFASSFPELFSDLGDMTTLDLLEFKLKCPEEYHKRLQPLKNMKTLIVSAIDQDPYFRIVRDIAGKLKENKPTLIYSKFLPSLFGKDTKMSASVPDSSIYLTDTPKKIKTKINKYAFSGGQETKELHQKLGGNLDVDVSYQYLEFFCDDDNIIKEVKTNYPSGKMLTGELKKLTIDCLTKIVNTHQENKKKVNFQVVKSYMTPRQLLFPQTNN